MDRSSVDWHGVMPAIVTPFDRDGKFNEEAYCRLIELNIGWGVTGIVVTGCSGEPWAQTFDERKHLFKLAVDTAKGRIKVLAGTGDIRPSDVIDMSRYAQDVGCDGSMIVAPYFPRLHSADDLVCHYQAISDAVDLPIMAYNVPAYNKNVMTPEIIDRLADIEHVVAIKDSATDWGDFYRAFELTKDRILYFTGQLSLYGLAAIEHGVVGAVSGAPNIWGPESVEFFNACKKGDKARALRLQKKGVDLWDIALANHRNLYPAIKAGMNLQGLPGGCPRPPLRPLGEPDISELRDGMARLGFDVLQLAAE